MAGAPKTTPVTDSVSKVNDDMAVGSDLDFQRRWHKTERVVWLLLALFLVLSLAGAFGRGPIASATAEANDGSFSVKYERIQRFGTPSVITVQFQQGAIRDGRIQLWVSESLVKPLGNQRVVPQPWNFTIGSGGILYTFSA